jgi:hypothetical protein
MQYINLGRTGLKVSRLCLGTMNYGPHASESEGHAQMDKALELGINFFDTADVYGSSTLAVVTLPGGTSPMRCTRPGNGIFLGWCASSPNTACSAACRNWKCCPPQSGSDLV